MQVTKVSGEYIKYFYDATGKKLCQQVYTSASVLTKQTDYSGELFYENDTLKFINHEEGRVVMTGTSPEYQYHLKDHLGNVRVTFTAKVEAESPVATMETANESSEQNDFLYYNEAVKVDFELFDHTKTGITHYSTRLNGTANERTGLAKSLSVMPGDVIKAEVHVKYLDPSDEVGWSQSIQDLMYSISHPPVSGGPLVDGGAIGSTGGVIAPFMTLLDKTAETGDAPKAFLNYMVFDRDYKLLDGGYIRVTELAKEDGQPPVADHETLAKELLIKKPGYVYIYLSNDNVALGGSPVEVYFDDFKVEHTKSPVVQADDYYPFGLTFNSYKIENSLANDHVFAGKEVQNELSLEIIDFGLRMYDPTISRWLVIDPLAHKLYACSPYDYALDNPVIFVDPDGALPWPVHIRSFISTPTTGGGTFRGDGRVPSTSSYPEATSRVRSSFTVDPAKGTVKNLTVKSDPTIFFGGPGPNGTRIPPIIKEGKPEASIENVKSSQNTTSFDFSHSGEDPVTPALVTPALDIHSTLSITEDIKKGTLSITGSFTGDTFPSTEAFIVDQSGNGKVFLGAKLEEGGIHSLFGDHKEPLFKVNIQVQFDTDGNFTGVQQGDKKYTVDEWNKYVQNGFK